MGFHRRNSLQKTLVGVTAVWYLIFICSPTLGLGADKTDNSIKELYSLYSLRAPIERSEAKSNLKDVELKEAYKNRDSAVETEGNIDYSELEVFESKMEYELNSMYELDTSEILLRIEYYLMEREEILNRINNQYLDIKPSTYTSNTIHSKQLSDLYNSIEYFEFSLPVICPIVTVMNIASETKEYTEYRTYRGTLILSLMEGTVTEITDRVVTIETGKGIEVVYSGLVEPSVSIGNKVEQYQKIGYSDYNIRISLKLDGNYYNLNPLNLKSFVNPEGAEG